MVTSTFNLHLPYPDVFPKAWDKEINPRDYLAFRNLDHFKFIVSQITQKEDNKCDMSYAKALDMLLKEQSDFPEEEQESIRNLVRSNLHKRGLITEEVYEAFKYAVEGTQVGVDVGKYAAGEPDCVITTSRQYVDFFYELYVSISYPYYISNKQVRKNIAKLLATIEELERQHIFIKITLVLPIQNAAVGEGNKHFFSSIPLFSHKDNKSVSTMSAVVNDRLLRKFYFAILEDLYKERLHDNYGYAFELPTAMNVGNEFDEITFFKNVVEAVGA